jgi:nucleotide-binding universal stress UspA family protein
MIKSIVVAVDGSRAARKAIDMAGDIAKSSGATVHLLHVIKEPEIPEALQEFAEVEHISGPPQAILHKAARYVLEDADTRAKAAGPLAHPPRRASAGRRVPPRELTRPLPLPARQLTTT